MARAYDKKVKPNHCKQYDLVLKKIIPFIEDPRGQHKPNYESPYLVNKVLSGGGLILLKMDADLLLEPFILFM